MHRKEANLLRDIEFVPEYLELLDELDNLLCDSSKWVKGTLAKTLKGTECDPIDPKANCYCLTGAIIRTNHHYFINSRSKLPLENLFAQDIHRILTQVCRDKHNRSNIIHFNDFQDTTFKDVKNLIADAKSIVRDRLNAR